MLGNFFLKIIITNLDPGHHSDLLLWTLLVDHQLKTGRMYMQSIRGHNGFLCIHIAF